MNYPKIEKRICVIVKQVRDFLFHSKLPFVYQLFVFSKLFVIVKQKVNLKFKPKLKSYFFFKDN